MFRVLVSPNKTLKGKWSVTRKPWASFRIYQDACDYMGKLRQQYPDWIIELKEGHHVRTERKPDRSE